MKHQAQITSHDLARLIMQGESEYRGIKLPTPQTSGTYFQQYAYALQKAQSILKELSNG